ncbi:hypothetical protein CH306_02945 [Rhodococcus sp. 15-725-2-2b]|nr:hypothetical protein CH277_01220 [Rhodococcus sp. 06-469-3-2]OZD48854.1 hypothetical protein CH264_06445 [Rhodococcus sp. 06-1477-1A]OZE77638.1 hypothetical protein CH306_02945 [Rhodococcus sp. 15-725-2-2b]
MFGTGPITISPVNLPARLVGGSSNDQPNFAPVSIAATAADSFCLEAQDPLHRIGHCGPPVRARSPGSAGRAGSGRSPTRIRHGPSVLEGPASATLPAFLTQEGGRTQRRSIYFPCAAAT